MSKDKDKEYILDFFNSYGQDTFTAHDAHAYHCDNEVSIEKLYEMFKARMLMEAEDE